MTIIVKTTSTHVEAVRRARKYATDDPPLLLKPGDDVLVQVTVLSNRGGPPTIRYRMKFVRAYEDLGNECLQLWGDKWRFIIECSDLCLLRPFDIARVQRSDKDYGAAVRYVYVQEEDELYLRANGYLKCV